MLEKLNDKEDYKWVCHFCLHEIKRNQPIADTYCLSCAITLREADA